MKITELVTSQTIVFDLKSKNQSDLINELTSKLVKNGNVSNHKQFAEEIIKREELSTTAFGGGIAIPHAKCDAVNIPAVCFGKSVDGVDYNAMDGNKVNLFFMIAAPSEGGDLHLKTLAKLARKLVHEEFKARLLNANNKDELLNILSEIDE